MQNQMRRYKFINEIGQGGFAKVYAASLEGYESHFAVKVVMHTAEESAAAQNEIALQLRLQHPNIIPILDYWTEEYATYLVMPLISGGNLTHQLLIYDTLHPLDAAKLLIQLASALDYLHRQKIVHLDVKPDNILLDNNDTPYLTDFGIACDLSNNQKPTTSSVLLGSPRYMSPEQLRREAISPRSDIYSLGLMIYQVLTGCLPYEARNLKDLCKQQLYHPVPALQSRMPELPLELNTVIARATRKNPSERYGSVLEFAEEFYEIAANTSVRA